MEPPGGGRHRWENQKVECAGAYESKREPSEFQSRNGISEIEGKAARVAASEWEPPGGARHRGENRQVEWSGAQSVSGSGASFNAQERQYSIRYFLSLDSKKSA